MINQEHTEIRELESTIANLNPNLNEKKSYIAGLANKQTLTLK